ncbi:MAG: TetR/AcrR family transcriptional regulator [Nocardioides sp.]|uniref:TetR/AcrR family transcriptional regulator n=1 Tax=Nocardioides sp. TaxID=35761 RepID=UPI003F04FEE6
MARPSKESGLAPAAERIKAAFWELFPAVPLAELSVQRITSRAGLNRSTFYRCFTSLGELIEEIEDEVIPVHVPGVVVAALDAGDLMAPLRDSMDAYGENFDRLCLLLSQRGDPGFMRRVKDAMIEAWVHALGGEVADLDDATRTVMEFLVSGATGTFAYRGERGLDVDTLDVIKAWAPLIAAPVVTRLRERIGEERRGG